MVRKGEVRNACRILVGERSGKKPLGRPEIAIISENDIEEPVWIRVCKDRSRRRDIGTVMNLLGTINVECFIG